MFLATTDFVFPVQLARAFIEGGCELGIVSVDYSPLQKINGANFKWKLPICRPHACIIGAIKSWCPVIIVPCDDEAAFLLFEIRPLVSKDISDIIQKSQGSAQGFLIASSKKNLMSFANQVGVTVPETINLETKNSIEKIEQYPCFIKQDGTFGGQGVTIARCPVEAAEAFRTKFADIISCFRQIASGVRRKKYWLLRQLISSRPSQHIAQQAIIGRDANRLVFCCNGQVLAGISVEVKRAKHKHGPAAIVKFIDHQQMSESSQLLVKELNLSGFYGFDYIIEHDTQRAFLLEVNPRSTQIGHLTNYSGISLVRAVCESIGWELLNFMPPIKKNYVALFPAGFELFNDLSGRKEEFYFDLPVRDASLVEDELRKDYTGNLKRFVENLEN